MKILVQLIDVVFVKAYVPLTHYTIRDDYSDHDCTQLPPCGPMVTLDVQGRTECVLQALLVGADIFIHREDDDSCLLCRQAYMGDGIAEVHSSKLVCVKGVEIFIIL